MHRHLVDLGAADYKVRPLGAPYQQVSERTGEPGGTRTRDHLIKSQMLYQLSYRPVRKTVGRTQA